MSLRDWNWSFGLLKCDHSEFCDLDNGTWKSPDNKRFYCWKHYQIALQEEANNDILAVKTERERIADGLIAWLEMWSKPNRIAFTNRTASPSETINKSWIKKFADKIRDGTFGKPHNSEPDPLYEI